MTRRKLSYQEVKNTIEKRGFKLLDDHYENSKIPLLLKCPRGHNIHMTLKNFKLGTKCQECNKNKYEIRGDITAIFVESPKYGHKEIVIDTDNLDEIKKHVWHVSYVPCIDSFYALTNIHKRETNRVIKMHRLICKTDLYVDHINHNTLDNRKSNLRPATNSENLQNRIGIAKNNKSGVRGVCWHKKTEKWIARLKVNKKTVFEKEFSDLEEAKKSIEEARKIHYPFSIN